MPDIDRGNAECQRPDNNLPKTGFVQFCGQIHLPVPPSHRLGKIAVRTVIAAYQTPQYRQNPAKIRQIRRPDNRILRQGKLENAHPAAGSMQAVNFI